MGGMRGEVRGKSKIEAYQEYVEQTDGWENIFLEMNPDPSKKKLCKSLMGWDPSAEEWVLNYHLHT